MAKRTSQRKGVFCLETASWEPGTRDRSSIEHVLRLLETTEYKVPYLHFDVATREEFDFYLKKWAGTSFAETHPVLYLGFHGAPGELWLGERRENCVTLDEIGERLRGACKGRVFHLGACSTLDLHGNKLNSFLRQTGALAICGFKESIEWLPSAAFEMLVLGRLQEVEFTRPGMRKFQGALEDMAPGLFRTLGFRVWVNPG